MQFLLLLILHKREPQEQAALRTVVIASAQIKHQEEIREMAETGAQALEAKGRQEGRQEGYILLLLAKLEQKFGPLPAQTIQRVQTLEETQLTRLGRQIITAQTLKELGL